MAGTQQLSWDHEEKVLLVFKKCPWSLSLSYHLSDLIQFHGFKYNLSADDSQIHTSKLSASKNELETFILKRDPLLQLKATPLITPHL